MEGMPTPTQSSTSGKPEGITIMSQDSRVWKHQLLTERQERNQSIADIWQEVDTMRAEMVAMAKAVAKVGAAPSAGQSAEGAEVAPDVLSRGFLTMHSELAALKDEVGKQRKELAELRDQVAAATSDVGKQQQELTALRDKVASAAPTASAAADPQGSKAKMGSTIARVFSSGSSSKAPAAAEAAESATSSSVQALRERLQVLEEALKTSAGDETAGGGQVPRNNHKLNFLESKVNDHGQALVTIRYALDDIHATMPKVAQAAEMSPDERRTLYDELEGKDWQANGPMVFNHQGSLKFKFPMQIS